MTPPQGLCEAKTASISDICFGKCQIRLPITILSDKKPYPKGFITMGKNIGCFSGCLWRYKNDKEYEKVLTFFLDDYDAITMQSIIYILTSALKSEKEDNSHV